MSNPEEDWAMDKAGKNLPSKSFLRRSAVQDACLVCGKSLSEHDDVVPCLRSGFGLADDWEFTKDSIVELGIEKGFLTGWGQPGPGVRQFLFSDNLEVGMSAQSFEVPLAKIYLRRFVPKKGSEVLDE